MTNDDKALEEELMNMKASRHCQVLKALARIRELSATLAEAEALLELQNQDIGRLREKLIGIRAEIDDMENPFNGGGAPDAEYGFETAVDQAVNIVTAALENSNDRDYTGSSLRSLAGEQPR